MLICGPVQNAVASTVNDFFPSRTTVAIATRTLQHSFFTMMKKTRSVFLLCITALSVNGFIVPNNSLSRAHVSAFVSPLAMRSSNNPLESLLGGFLKTPKEVTPPPPPSLPDVVIEPDFRLAGIFLVGGLLLDTIPYIQLVLGPLITVLGILFLIQTFRIRFVFDETAFELKQGDSLEDTGENVVVGGANRWTYDSFVNVSALCFVFWSVHEIQYRHI
jgi:hypothetical protein